jgi:hypothetical protein
MLRTTIFSLVLLLVLIPVGMIEKTGASQSEKAWIVQALQEYVLKDKLDESIAHEVATGKPVEAFVVFEESDIQAEARKLRAASLVDEDTSEIVEHKAGLFREKKHTVLSRLLPSDYEIIEDYQHFAITFVRFHTAEAIFQLLQDPDVLSIRENRMMRLQLEESLPLIRAPEAHALGARGSGTSVAVLDTGVDYTRPEFGSCSSPGSGCKVIHAQDFAPEDNSLDDDGHGTNVAAIVLGVAPDTRIISLDVFQVTREGRRALANDILRAIDFVIENKDRHNIVAMNLSLGSGKFNSPCKSSVYRSAIVNAKSAGIATIAASGNEAFADALREPACVPEAISVGAVYDSATFSPLVCTLKRLGSTCVDILPAADKVTCFSNSASFLTLLAPGAAINAGGHTGCGTSQAAPHVAGAVAAIKSVNSSLTPDQIKTILTETGVPIRDERNNITKPRLDLYRATVFATRNSCEIIDLGSWFYDRLSVDDLRSVARGGSYFADRYCFFGTAGTRIMIAMFSDDFDTYLYLLNSNNSIIQADDDGAGGYDSRIPSSGGAIVLPYTGAYIIEATSFSSGATGRYSLVLDSVEPGVGNIQITFDPNPVPPSRTVFEYDLTITNNGDTGVILDRNYYADAYDSSGRFLYRYNYPSTSQQVMNSLFNWFGTRYIFPYSSVFVHISHEAVRARDARLDWVFPGTDNNGNRVTGRGSVYYFRFSSRLYKETGHGVSPAMPAGRPDLEFQQYQLRKKTRP